jgi:lauroyl/myristoyl acyltransferase
MQPVRRFDVQGVLWRRFSRWASGNVPVWLERTIILGWTCPFFFFWAPGRRAVMENLRVIAPAIYPRRLFRTFRLFLNFALTFTDTVEYTENGFTMDWEIEGGEHFDSLLRLDTGAIILTAHMGNYDLGSYLFGKVNRPITIVRAPEPDPETEEFSRKHREKAAGEKLNVNYSGESGSGMAIALVEAIHRGEIVAIQGDRIIPGVTSIGARLFDHTVPLPAGPFALAMATGVPIYPLFVVRRAHRTYRVIVGEPLLVRRTGGDRNADLQRSVDTWCETLERVIRRYWHQWFTFTRYFPESR